MTIKYLHLSLTAAVFLVATTSVAATAVDELDFNVDVFPVLEEHCLHCHGEDEQESGLRLDLRSGMLRGGDSGLAAVVPENAKRSYLIDVINHVDEDMAMPPDEDKIPAEQIELLTRWIDEGAVWPGQMDDVAEEEIDHWAFLPPQKEFEFHSIDEFLKRKLEEAGLDFSKPADPRSLIRRASIVLTGLAPTPERTEAFLDAFEKNTDDAYAI